MFFSRVEESLRGFYPWFVASFSIFPDALSSIFMAFNGDKRFETINMVREERRGCGKVYVCERCGFAYEETRWAERMRTLRET